MTSIGMWLLAVAAISGATQASSASKSGDALSAPTGSFSVFVGCGTLLIENHKDANYTAFLREARSIPHTETAWLIADTQVQVISTGASKIGAPESRGLELLRKHMLWEAAFISQKREWPNLKPKGRKIEAGLGPGIEVMLWGFDVPTPYRLMEKMIVRRLYLSASIGSSVFVLTTALGAADDPRTAARILLSVVRTLRVRTLPVELSTLSEEIKNGPRPWPGCATGAIP